MKLLILLLLLLTSCPATPQAGFRRMAAARLQICIQNNPCVMSHFCFQQSEGFCLDAGMEKSCGEMEDEGTCGDAIK